jgi:hypothetical protein
MNTRKTFLGSARGSRAGECVLALANFFVLFNAWRVAMQKENLFRPATETSTRAACAPQNK